MDGPSTVSDARAALQRRVVGGRPGGYDDGMPEGSNGQPWYADGLKFRCTQCGNCCSGAPGYVWVTREEIRRIAEFLGRGDDTLDPTQLRGVGPRWSLTERKNGDCVFLRTEAGKRICGIYPVRPLQCRTWPFWDQNLDSPTDWARASEDCPGINRGPRYSLVQIEVRRTAKCWDAVDSATGSGRTKS